MSIETEKQYYTDMETYRFSLAFRGQLLENSVDAFDVANTILATTYALQEIASIKFGEEQSKNLRLNISAFKDGSLISDFLYHFAEVAQNVPPVLLPIAPSIFEASKTVLDGLGTYIEIKKLLKGRPPESVKAINDQKVEIKIGDGNVINITYNDFRVLQNNTITKNIAKAIQPLRKEDSLLEGIEITRTGETEPIQVTKEDAQYFESKDSFQILPTVSYKGIITKIDSKVRSGYINVGPRRIPFIYPQDLKSEQFVILVESLKRKIQIFLVGDVTMDYENNPKSISITEVRSDIELF